MDDQLGASPAPPLPPTGEPDPTRRKKKGKVRSAWISFVGRILAQVIGAVATVVLGVLVLQRMQSGDTPVEPAGAPPAPVSRPARASGLVSIAVLPLDNFSADPKQEYFADGMTEALIANLAQIEGLHVISRRSVMRYKTERPSLQQVAEQLSVDLVVEGSVVKVGEQVRITAQLIDAATDRHLWARTYDRTMRDVLALQAEVATAIAREVKGTIPVEFSNRVAARRPVDPAAYELYLRGRHAWNLRTPEGFAAAAAHFEQAVERDPNFALAHAGIADVYSMGGSPSAAASSPRENFVRAKAAAERALALDTELAEAHTSLAAVYFFGERNFAAATREFERALELNPGYPTAHQWYAISLAEQGRDADALSHAQQAVKLDPLSGAMNQSLGFVHYYARRYEDAAKAQRRALELNPQLPLARVILAKALLLAGKYGEIADVVKAAAGPPGGELLMTLGLAHLKAGDRVEAERILQQLLVQRPQPRISLAQWYAATGEHKIALDMLEQAAQAGSFPGALQVDPMFDSLRADPRFAHIVQRTTSRETR